MAQYIIKAVNLTNCAQKLVIKSKYLRSRRYKKRKARAKKRRNLYYKRKYISRDSVLKKCINMSTRNMSDNQQLTECNITRKFVKHNTEWQQHQSDLAYWKARAISLEYENQMLYKYIKQIYVNAIEQNNVEDIYNEDYEDEQNYDNEELYNEQEQDTTNDDDDDDYSSKIKGKCENTSAPESDSESKPPAEQISKRRNEDMEAQYGSAWRKILGMETAVQLHYEHVNEKDINFWPVIPIKISK